MQPPALAAVLLRPALSALAVWLLTAGAFAAPRDTAPASTPRTRRPPTPATVPQPPQPPAPPAVAPLPPESFGRWQPTLPGCARNLAQSRSTPCGSVLVDQRSSGVYRVNWIGSGGREQASVLSFVGILTGRSQPMVCRQAICRLEKPLTLTLSSVSEALFDRRGVASGLPSAWPVSGSCELLPHRIRCEARALSGETWLAQAGAP